MQRTYPLIEVYYSGTRWTLIPGGADSGSYFGGPHSEYVGAAVPVEDAAIHHVATLKLPEFGIGNPQFGFSLCLLYGLCHESCTIEYRKTATAAVEITELDPPSITEGYPYEFYSPILPYFTLGIDGTNSYEFEELKDHLYNTGWEVRQDCLYAVVSQHPAIGYCLFDAAGETEIVFEYDPKVGRVRATNQCT